MPLLHHSRYEVVERLGRGAQGIVLRVVDRESKDRRLVAKLLATEDDQALRGEFALLAGLRIPGVVVAYDFARDEQTGAAFLIEELVDGPSLTEWLATRSDGRARFRALATVVASLAESLDALHRAGVVHGDLKPAHVRIRRAPGVETHGPTIERIDRIERVEPVILDLGAAVALGAGAAGFSPAFAAPEVLAGAACTAASDRYSLGATLWAASAGDAPSAGASGDALRARARWIPPSLADLIASMLRVDPSARPDASEILAALGRDRDVRFSLEGAAAPVAPGREATLAEILAEPPAGSATRVRWIIGAAGMGKSHLLRVAHVRGLLDGRPVRLLRKEDDVQLRRLVPWLREPTSHLPWLEGSARALLLIDDPEAVSAELIEALEAYRCAPSHKQSVAVVVAARTAPRGAPTSVLGPLDDDALDRLALEAGEHEPRARRAAIEASNGSPGWLLASLGRAMLDADAARARVANLSAPATDLLALVALAGGALSNDCLRAALGSPFVRARAELFSAGLLTRTSREQLTLPTPASDGASSPSLATPLAQALATPVRVEALARALLTSASADPSACLALCRAPILPDRFAELLDLAAARARAIGARSMEIEALRLRLADPHARTRARLVRLERLVRDAGIGRAHPEVLGWLGEAAERDDSLIGLWCRRVAEQKAREGQPAEAASLIERARDWVSQKGPEAAADRALIEATAATIALFGGDWITAQQSFARVEGMLAPLTADAIDAEERARIDHNAGVVAMWRGDTETASIAFARSLAKKRVLGDLPGVRSCLLNLGLAETRAGRFDSAEEALDEALALARSLGQSTGLAWSLVAAADLARRRRDFDRCARIIAEAESIGDSLPPTVFGDLALVRADAALDRDDVHAARAVLDGLAPSLLESDAAIGVRVSILRARALLASLPRDSRGAARLAIGAARRARKEQLPEFEALARSVVAQARGRIAPQAAKVQHTTSPLGGVEQGMSMNAWSILERVAQGADHGTCVAALLAWVLEQSGAERAFVARVNEAREVVEARGADLDGLPLSDAEARLPAGVVADALAADGPLVRASVASGGRVGSLVAIANANAVLVLEHRFIAGKFDALAEDDVRRWGTLCAVITRIAAATSTVLERPRATRDASDSAAQKPFDETTLIPRKPKRSIPGIVGESASIRHALARLESAIGSDLPVLIVGETGVGKELFARALHDLGPRAKRPFVAVNCAAIADSLFDAELFGHVRGAFTGADKSRPGLLMRADGGTLLLDELGELPLARQASLLRALQTRTARAVGSDEERPFDVRIVAATNRDLRAAVADGTFRRDLWFRLRSMEIDVPPLRERDGDIPLLARQFLRAAGSHATLTPAALDALHAYDWPGNVRELEAVMARLAAGGWSTIDSAHLPRELRRKVVVKPAAAPATEEPDDSDDERRAVRAALTAAEGNITHAAARLGLTRHGLKKKMLRLGLRAPGQEKSG